MSTTKVEVILSQSYKAAKLLKADLRTVRTSILFLGLLHY